MNAFPMLERSFEAQWRGLTPEERDELDRARHRNGFPVRIDRVGQQMQPIWQVEWAGIPGVFLTLLSVKRDVVR